MKKIVLSMILFLMVQGAVYGENQLDYSLMAASPEARIYEIEEDPESPYLFDVDLGFETTLSWEDEFYNKLDGVFSPENIVNQQVGKFDGTNYYYIFAPYVDFQLDFSLGNIQQQASVRALQIHEVYTRYLQNNPEYFYLIPRQYGISYDVTSKNKLRIWLAPVIAYDFPGFDGSKEALSELVTKYNILMSVIEDIKEEIYFEGMTDLDKLLLAHDYIINNCAYYLEGDYYGDGYSYNAYGILVNRKGVCQGLSYAYPCILKALGYGMENVRQIRSDELKHMWNFVKFGDSWYHVDLTWDDPLYAVSGGQYDMTNESLQHEHHGYFLMSDATNTKKRAAKGYTEFTLEILGYDDNDHLLADDNSYESGYFFNDPVNNALAEVPGRVEYENGYYKKYYKNDNVCFTSDTIKAQKYMVSQITYNQYDVPQVLVLGAKQRTRPNETVTQYISYYENGRFKKTIPVTQSLTGFGMFPADDYVKPESGQSVKIMTMSGFTPIANVAIMGGEQ